MFSSTTLAKRNETINTTLVSAGCVLWTQKRREQTRWTSSTWGVGDPSRYSTTARVIHSHYVWSLKLRVICTLQFPRRSITSCGSWETTMVLLTCLIEARTTLFPQVLEHSSLTFNLEVHSWQKQNNLKVRTVKYRMSQVNVAILFRLLFFWVKRNVTHRTIWYLFIFVMSICMNVILTIQLYF